MKGAPLHHGIYFTARSCLFFANNFFLLFLTPPSPLLPVHSTHSSPTSLYYVRTDIFTYLRNHLTFLRNRFTRNHIHYIADYSERYSNCTGPRLCQLSSSDNVVLPCTPGILLQRSWVASPSYAHHIHDVLIIPLEAGVCA